jgi:flavocytochrome c
VKRLKETKSNFSRRDFIKTTVVGAGATALAGLGAKEVWAAPPPKRWDKETDVLVVGGGGAGLAAALEARAAGARVLLIEKMPFLGGHTGLSVGNFAAAGTSFQRGAGIIDSSQKHFEDIMHAEPRCNPEFIRILADNAADTFEWLVGLGVPFMKPPVLRPHDSVARAHMANPDARVFPQVLGKVARAKGIDIQLETSAKRLVVDGAGKVLGLLASNSEGKNFSIKAGRGIVLASGDNSASQKMKAKYSAPAIAALPPSGNIGNTGDGLLMAMALGAEPLCLDGCGSPSGPMVRKVPGDTGFISDLYKAGAIVVNKQGNRFTNELLDIAAKTPQQPDQVAYCIFAQETADQNTWLSTGRYLADWKKYNAVTEAGSIEELGQKLNIDPGQLRATVDKWNQFVANGTDADFGRKDLGRKITTPPFYGLGPAKSYVILTDGTLMVDKSQRVLNVFGEAIPRLYAAGDMGKSGKVALHGTHVAWAFVSGRIAGKNVAK